MNHVKLALLITQERQYSPTQALTHALIVHFNICVICHWNLAQHPKCIIWHQLFFHIDSQEDTYVYTVKKRGRERFNLQRVNLKQLLCWSFLCYQSFYNFLSSLLISLFLLKDQSIYIFWTANLTLLLVHEAPGFVREPYVEQSEGSWADTQNYNISEEG